MQELALPLKMYLQKFPRRQELHAYESALLELTLGEGKYEEVIVLTKSSEFIARGLHAFSRTKLMAVRMLCLF